MFASKQFSNKAGRHTLLLVCLLVTMVCLPLLEHLPIGRILLSVWFLLTSGVLLASFSGKGRQHRILLLAGGIFSALLLANLVIQSAGWSSTAFQMIAFPVWPDLSLLGHRATALFHLSGGASHTRSHFRSCRRLLVTRHLLGWALLVY